MYSQLRLSAEQKYIATNWLIDLLSNTDVDWIVSANAMATLVQFAKEDFVSAEVTVRLLKLQQKHKSKSVKRKAQKLLQEFTQCVKAAYHEELLQ